MGIYKELGVKPLINAAGTYTVLGGSRMSEKTLADMAQAASSFVQIKELQKAVHRELASLTRNEGAYVSNGAATGLFLAVAACIQRKLGKPLYYTQKSDIQQMNVVMFKAHRNPYDLVIGHLGAQYRELSFPNIILPPTEQDIEQAIDENTAAIYYAQSGWVAPGFLPLEQTIAIARRYGVPVIVDAAAQLPPVENLWHFTTELGADIALFSGGKDLRGPQASGLMVGKRELTEMVASIGFPNYGVGRMMKVGREELVGLYSAISQYLEMDHQARYHWCEAQIKKIQAACEGSTSFCVERSYPNEAGQPIARAFVRIVADGITPEALCTHMREGDPAVWVNSDGQNGIYINPMTLTQGETEQVIRRLLEFS